MLAMTLPGPLPAMAIGIIVVVVDARVRGLSSARWINNLATYSVFPVANGWPAGALAAGRARPRQRPGEPQRRIRADRVRRVHRHEPAQLRDDRRPPAGLQRPRPGRSDPLPVDADAPRPGRGGSARGAGRGRLHQPRLPGAAGARAGDLDLPVPRGRAAALGGPRRPAGGALDAPRLAAAGRARHARRDTRPARPHDRPPRRGGGPLSAPQALAREAGCDESEQDVAHTAGLLHDIGKFALPDRILKAEVLSDEDWAQIRRHPQDGATLVGRLDGYGPIADAILYHHEQIDGSGYPAGLIGSEIPQLSRILAICSAYDTMTSRDSYRSPMTAQDALVELRRMAGRQFDSELWSARFVGDGRARRNRRSSRAGTRWTSRRSSRSSAGRGRSRSRSPSSPLAAVAYGGTSPGQSRRGLARPAPAGTARETPSSTPQGPVAGLQEHVPTPLPLKYR